MKDELLNYCRKPFFDDEVPFQDDQGGGVRLKLPHETQEMLTLRFIRQNLLETLLNWIGSPSLRAFLVSHRFSYFGHRSIQRSMRPCLLPLRPAQLALR